MKVNKKSLTKFLELLLLQGELENNSAILNISENYVKGLSASDGQISAVSVEISGTYENIGNIGIGNIKKLLNFLNDFDSNELDITKRENKLIIISDKLELSYTLENTDYITNTITQEKFNTFLEKSKGNEFELTKEQIRKITNYVSSVGSDSLYLNGNANSIQLDIESNGNSISAEIDIKETLKTFDIRVGRNLLDILDKIDENLLISIKNSSPIGIFYENDNLKASYVLAQWKKE